MTRKTLLAVLCCTPFLSFAEDAKEEEKSPFKTSAGLGALFKTGDTKSADLKASFDVEYEQDQWRSVLDFDLLIKKTEEEDETGDTSLETSDHKWTIDSRTNYTIEPNGKNYVFGNISYEDNRFGSFETQSSISAGWGRRWYETKVAKLDAEIGPGYKRDVPHNEDEETQSSLIIQASAYYSRQINEHVEFKQSLIAKYAPSSDENSTYKAETSVTTKLIETMQLKFSFLVDYNTDVEVGKENTNTETAITVVYSF